MKIAVLFGFCASARDPETAMLSAIAACCSSDGDESEGVRMTGISRATVTERGEYCVKQVLSLEVLVKGVRLPTANTLNAVLPQSVRVFKVIRVDKSFSARRMCDFRTYEYLIPTYAFAPPPPQTGFPFRSDVESFDVLVNSSATTDSVFDTMKKAAATVKQSAASLRSRSKSRERSSANTNDVDSPITVTPTVTSPSSLITQKLADMGKEGDSLPVPADNSNQHVKSPTYFPQTMSTSFGKNVKSFFGALKKRSSGLMSRSDESLAVPMPVQHEPQSKRLSAAEPSMYKFRQHQQHLSTSAPTSPHGYRADFATHGGTSVSSKQADYLPTRDIPQRFNARPSKSDESSTSVFPDDGDDDEPVQLHLAQPSMAQKKPPIPRITTQQTSTNKRSSISLPSAGSAFPDDEDDDGPVLVKASDSDSQSKKSSLLQKGGRSSLSPFPDDDDDIVGFETKVTPSGNIALPSTSPTATQSLIYQDPQANLPPLNHHHYKPSKQSRGPIDLLPTTEEDRSLLKRYRITPAQLDKIHSILEQYRGSHDWHNYMPALQQEQGGFENPFHRITNVSCSKPQFHYGMEWIQVQVSAPQPLPRGLFRSMMAMLVMVVRTNTPQSMIAASFGRGVAKIEGLPLAPVRGSGICDIGYNSWNESAAAQEGLIKFADDQNYVEGFAEGSVRDEVFIEEEDGMEFEEWLKEVDRHSYLYKHFLNARGVIRRDFV